MKVTITAKDILTGTRGHSLTCPLALALRRTTSHLTRVDIDQATVYTNGMQDPLGYMFYNLSPEAVDFVARFDGGGPCYPTELELIEQGATTPTENATPKEEEKEEELCLSV